jgi:hypothetical protein
MVSNDGGVESHSRLSVGHGMNEHDYIKDEYHSKWIKSLAHRMNLCTKCTAVKMLGILNNQMTITITLWQWPSWSPEGSKAKPSQTMKLLDLLKRNKWEVTNSLCIHQDNLWPRNTLEYLLWIEWFFKIVRIKQLFLKSKIMGHGLWNNPQIRSKLKPISFSTLSYQILFVDLTQSLQK